MRPPPSREARRTGPGLAARASVVLRALAVAACAGWGAGAGATSQVSAPAKASPQTVRPECIVAAARHHRVNPQVLAALAWQESRYVADAVGRNTDGSIDFGAFQINSVHLPELRRQGIDERHLFDPCLSAYVAAWHYARQVRDLGHSWAAIGAYHSRTPARQRWYANQIATVLMRWGVVPAGPLPYAPATTLAPGQTSRAAGAGGKPPS